MAWRRVNETIAERLNYLADRAVGIGREPGPEPTTAIAELERAMDDSHLHTDAPLRGQLALDHRLVESISGISTAVQPGMS